MTYKSQASHCLLNCNKKVLYNTPQAQDSKEEKSSKVRKPNA